MNGINQYKSVGADSASPHKLIQMLFETYLVRVDQAIIAIESKDMELKSTAISKAIAIIGGLEEALDFEKGGEIAENLQSLYRYIKQQLLSASVTNDTSVLKEVRELIEGIKNAWNEIPQSFHYHSSNNEAP